jgi:hypothetical protein
MLSAFLGYLLLAATYTLVAVRTRRPSEEPCLVPPDPGRR